MLSKLIKNIRAKPEPVRKSITLGVSLGITGIVGFFWLISFLNYSSEVLLAKPKSESPASFVNRLGSLIGESYANVRSKMNESGALIEKDKGVIDTEAPSTPGDLESDGGATLENNTDTNKSAGTVVSGTASATTSSLIKQDGMKDGSKSTSVDLQDILNTKRPVNQENKATTSSEVLVQ
jgi:hypothetical protein